MGRLEKVLLFLWLLPPLTFWILIFDYGALSKKRMNLVDICQFVYLGAGSLVYVGYWISMVANYPQSRKEYFHSRMGGSTRALSIGGILITFFLSLGFGALVLPGIIVDAVRKWFVIKKD
jgi:hypothetical protein